MDRNAFRTDNFICSTPETGGVEFWIDWVPAIDGLPGRALRGEIVDRAMWVAPVDDSDPASVPGRLITPLNEDVLAEINETQDPNIFVVLCGPSGVISKVLVQMKSDRSEQHSQP